MNTPTQCMQNDAFSDVYPYKGEDTEIVRLSREFPENPFFADLAQESHKLDSQEMSLNIAAVWMLHMDAALHYTPSMMFDRSARNAARFAAVQQLKIERNLTNHVRKTPRRSLCGELLFQFIQHLRIRFGKYEN